MPKVTVLIIYRYRQRLSLLETSHSGMRMLVVHTSSLSCFTCPARVHAPNSLCKSSPLDSHFEPLCPPAQRQTVTQMGGIAVELDQWWGGPCGSCEGGLPPPATPHQPTHNGITNRAQQANKRDKCK